MHRLLGQMLNRVSAVVRSYDPCATHAGGMREMEIRLIGTDCALPPDGLTAAGRVYF